MIGKIFIHNGRDTMPTRILVINDTQEILDLFRILLEEEGFEVVLSGFPFQQVSEIEQISPDLIILDVIFSDEKTGWQMLQLLKMKRSTPSYLKPAESTARSTYITAMPIIVVRIIFMRMAICKGAP